MAAVTTSSGQDGALTWPAVAGLFLDLRSSEPDLLTASAPEDRKCDSSPPVARDIFRPSSPSQKVSYAGVTWAVRPGRPTHARAARRRRQTLAATPVHVLAMFRRHAFMAKIEQPPSQPQSVHWMLQQVLVRRSARRWRCPVPLVVVASRVQETEPLAPRTPSFFNPQPFPACRIWRVPSPRWAQRPRDKPCSKVAVVSSLTVVFLENSGGETTNCQARTPIQPHRADRTAAPIEFATSRAGMKRLWWVSA